MTTQTDNSSRSVSNGIQGKSAVDWTDLGKEMWAYLTGKGAAINYEFVDMFVEVPRDTGKTPRGRPGASTAPCASPRRTATQRLRAPDRGPTGRTARDGRSSRCSRGRSPR